MKWCRLAGVTAFISAVLAGVCWGGAAPIAAPAGWAVLVEYNSYGGRYDDLPVGYVNSARVLTALISRGWPPDHILLVRDSPDRAAVRRATEWLAARARSEDTALLYVAGEYQFFERDLEWGATLPPLWRRIETPHRVLIVETCFAGRLTAAVGGIPGLGLPAVGREELDWWGLRGTDRLIQGGSFTYFLARALESQPAGASVDFAAAFVTAVAGAQEYFQTVIATTPRALASFHARNSYPEHLTTFPNPRLTQAP
ncbi:MAG TPA: hypothetical protein VKT83_17960 [bacterium]|nr:hypothetical protein [bacterium]